MILVNKNWRIFFMRMRRSRINFYGLRDLIVGLRVPLVSLVEVVILKLMIYDHRGRGSESSDRGEVISRLTRMRIMLKSMKWNWKMMKINWLYLMMTKYLQLGRRETIYRIWTTGMNHII